MGLPPPPPTSVIKLINKVIPATLLQYIKDKNRLTLVLEYGETDLHSYLQNTACLRDNPTKQKYYEVCLLWHEMLTAVQCIHSHKIVHKVCVYISYYMFIIYIYDVYVYELFYAVKRLYFDPIENCMLKTELNIWFI